MNHARGAGYRVSWVVALVFVSVVTVESRAQNTTFNESIGPSLNDISEVRTNTLIGRYRVTDNVLNASGIGWTGLEIVAETQVGPDLFAPSGPGDGLSFDEPALFSDWRAAVTVAMDSISQGPAGGTWDVVRDDDPVDTITFTFSAFAVQPGEMLTLGFDMNDQAGANTWRLNQTAIPEPAGAMVLVIGCVLVARRSSV